MPCAQPITYSPATWPELAVVDGEPLLVLRRDVSSRDRALREFSELGFTPLDGWMSTIDEIDTRPCIYLFDEVEGWALDTAHDDEDQSVCLYTMWAWDQVEDLDAIGATA